MVTLKVLRRISRSRCGFLLLYLLAVTTQLIAQTATTTTLVLSPSTSPLPAKTAVTLTATVLEGATPVHPGLVTFCDASLTSQPTPANAPCAALAVVGTAQLTNAGTAVLKFVPGGGSHRYKAVFAGTKASATSTSTTQTLTVLPPTAPFATATAIASSGSAGSYTLTATVTATGVTTPALAGSVSFLDTTNTDTLGTVPLGAATRTPVPNYKNAPGSPVAVGTTPFAVAVGDFNGDGIADLAVANSDSNNVSILLGDGSGGFARAPGLPVAVGTNPYSVAVGDFNGDGIADLAVANYGSNNVSILLGDGSGGFAPAPGSPVAVDSGPFYVATGDFNGDGIADLAVTNYLSDNVSILLGDGNGGFTPAPGSPVAVGDFPAAVAVGDFDGDGIADLAVTNAGALANNVSILLGDGSGGFAPASGSPVAVGSAPNGVVTGDFNGDGIADLAVANFGSDNVSILLGDGSGGFAPAPGSPVAVGTTPHNLAVGDFNGDGVADLAVTNQDDNNVSILLGNGSGRFAPASGSPVAVGRSPYDVAVGDFNGDGIADLAVTNSGSISDNVSILLNQATQTATAELTGVNIVGGGTHDVNASYPGDTNFSGSISATIPLTATRVVTTLALTANPTTSTFGEQVVLTATLSPSSSESITTNGQAVTFFNGATSLGTGTLASGVATLNVTTLPLGTNSLTAVYAGDTNFVASTSPAVPFTVTPGIPAITSVNPNAGQQGINNLNVAIEGQFTHWVQGSTTVSLGAGITVNSVTVGPPGAGFISQVLGDNPKGFWILNDGPGSGAIDSSVNAFNGTYGTGVTPQGIAGPSWVQPSGLVASFTGGTISFPTPLDLGRNGYTIEAWINPSLSSLTQTTRFLASGSGLNGYGFGTASGGALHFTSFAQHDYVTTGLTLLPNQWQYVGVVLDASNNANFYVNGSLVETVAGLLPTNVPTGDFTIGNQSPGVGHTDEIFTGGLAGISVYNTALTPAQVQAQYNAATATGASLTANVSIAANAAAGTRNLTVTTGAEVVTLNNGFTVTAGTPAITQVNPNSGAQGASNVPVTITGNFTHFSAASVVTFGNAGVTVSAPTGTPTATSLTVNVSITGAAAPGATSVTVTTGAEVATLNNGFTVTPGTTTTLTSSANPQSAGNNVTFTATVVPMPLGPTGPTGTVSFYDGTTLLGTGTVRLVSGSYVATETTSSLTQGSHSIVATYSGDTDYLGSSGTLTQIINGVPASITASAGDGQTTVYGTPFANPLVATVKDSSGDGVPGVAVTFTANPGSNGQSGRFSNSTGTITVTTNNSGLASSGTFTANSQVGPYTVTAATGSLSATFNLANTPGAPASIALTSGSGQGATIGTAFANPLIATVTDAGGHPVPGATVTFTAPTGLTSSVVFSNASSTISEATDLLGEASSGPMTANGILGGPYDVQASVGSIAINFQLTNLGRSLTTFASLTTTAATIDVFGFGFSAPSGSLAFTNVTTGTPVTPPVPLDTSTAVTSLQPQVTTSTGADTLPVWTTLADVNGDGKLDLITSLYMTDSVSVQLGNGDGTFQAATNYLIESGFGPAEVHAVSLGNGTVDLIVGSFNLNQIAVLLGNGNGTFGAPALYTIGTPSNTPTSLTTGDFNDDGKLDVAVANTGDNTISILLGDGSGGLTVQRPAINVGRDPEAIRAGDFNGDGYSDLAVANYSDGTVTTLLNDKDGTFTATTKPVGSGAGSGPQALAINGNGSSLLLAVANYRDNTISVMQSNGTGSFGAQTIIPVGKGPDDVNFADFNGDGTPDLAVSNYTDSTVNLALGSSGGSYTVVGPFSVGNSPYSAAVGDLNLDDTPDLAVANCFSNNTGVLFDGTLISVPYSGLSLPPGDSFNASYTPDGVSKYGSSNSGNIAPESLRRLRGIQRKSPTKSQE